MKTSIDLIAPASAATAELHRRFCSDVPNDGTYTLHLNETETIRFFAEADRLIAVHCAAATAKERQARGLAEGENARLREALGRIRLLCSSDYNERDPFDQIAPICMEALKP